MGGFGSGKVNSRRKAWRSKKIYTTSLPKLEITKLMKLHLNHPKSRLTFGDIILKVTSANLYTSYSEAPTLEMLPINIKMQPCHFGGSRYFFHCPFCLRQTTSLYLYKKLILACRGCLNMVYPCQNETLSYRLRVKSQKAYEKLNKNVWSKPKWMRKSRFKELRELYFDCENMSDLSYMFSLKNLYAAKTLHQKYGDAAFVPDEIPLFYYGKNWRH